MVRDLAVFGILFWFAVIGLRHPVVGIIGWTWVSIMNPHRLAYGWVKEFPVAMMVGGAALVGLMLTKDRREFPGKAPEIIALILFMAWMCITLPFSGFFAVSFEMWKRVMKIDFMVLVAAALVHTRKHITTLGWILAVSIGFYGVKGGIFTILHGGSYRVWGPEDSYIGGNNEVALAIVVVIPLIRFLQLHGGIKGKLFHLAMNGWMLLCAFAALGSQSRGALLAISAMGFMFWLKSRNKALIGIVLVVAAVGLVSFMPASWTERMHSTQSYEKDASALGRINAWWMAYNAAKDRFFGTGYVNDDPYWFNLYAPEPDNVHAPHSCYFQVLGEHGFVGLFLYLFMLLQFWRGGARLRKLCRGEPRALWADDLAAMCQVSLVGFLVGGAFLGLPYWDLPYNVMLMLVAARKWVEEKGWEKEPDIKLWPIVESVPKKAIVR